MERICYSKCPYSIEDLDQFRDENGFIDLLDANLVVVEGSRNIIGDPEVFKYWVDFAGTKVLIKQEKKLEGEENGTIYSELYFHELCEEMMVESAQTDVFKIGDIKGIMSFLAYEPEKENLIMTHELIGDMPVDGDAYNFEAVEARIQEELVKQFKLSPKESRKLILERRLQKILQLYSSEMDNHTENEGFLFSRNENGSYNVKLCPMFDNERSFGLYSSYSEMMSDALYDNLELRTKALRKISAKIRVGEKLSKEDETLLKELSSKDEITDLLLGNMRLRYRVGSNGMQIMLDENKLPKSFSLTDATLTKLYMESNEIVNNQENLDMDEDEIECHEKIVRLVSSLKEIDSEELIDLIEDKIKIPDTIKTQINRFSKMKAGVIHFAERGIGEVEYYEKQAELILKERDKILNRTQEIE